VTGAVTEDEFDGFYAAHFGGTVAMTYGLAADLDDARDIAQEAFCRAWKQWHHVSVYDNPVTWVSRVATNLAFSRWRHLRVATVHLLRQRVDKPIESPTPQPTPSVLQRPTALKVQRLWGRR
jgi:RNA polymerase sigma-70 factor (ECF subfamily)